MSPDSDYIDDNDLGDAVRTTLRTFGIRQDFPVELESRSLLFFSNALATVDYAPPPGERIERIVLRYRPPLRRDVLAFEIGHLKLTCMKLPHYHPTENLVPHALYFGAFHDEFYDRLLLSRDFPATSVSLISLELAGLPGNSQMSSDLAIASLPGTREHYRMLPRITQWMMDRLVCSSNRVLEGLIPEFDRVLGQARATIFNDVIDLMQVQLGSMPPLPVGSDEFEGAAQISIQNAVGMVHAFVFGDDVPFRRLPYTINCS